MKKLLIVTITMLLLICTSYLLGLMAGNESPTAFLPEGESGEQNAPHSNQSLSYLVAQGGSYFLQSAGHFHRFLGLVESSEIQGVDFKAFQAELDAAASTMEKTVETYEQLKLKSFYVSYNYLVISRLTDFDYSGFQRKTDLIPCIFNKVRKYLAYGDVRGMYGEFQHQTSELLKALAQLKKEVDADVFPSPSSLWRLNQKYAEFKLFGQYAAEVFYSIK
jgi:hypothetical protein